MGFPALTKAEFIEELRELGPPEGEEERVDEIFTGVEEVVAGGEDDPSTVIGNENRSPSPTRRRKRSVSKSAGSPDA